MDGLFRIFMGKIETRANLWEFIYDTYLKISVKRREYWISEHNLSFRYFPSNSFEICLKYKTVYLKKKRKKESVIIFSILYTNWYLIYNFSRFSKFLEKYNIRNNPVRRFCNFNGLFKNVSPTKGRGARTTTRLSYFHYLRCDVRCICGIIFVQNPFP